MTKNTRTKNETFWPDDLVFGENRAPQGWTPVVRVLTANWEQFGLGDECFATLVWLLSWVRGKNINDVRFVQAAIAKQMGRSRSTIYRRMETMVEAGVIAFVGEGHLSFQPLMEKLREFEKKRQAKAAARSAEESMKAAGLLVDVGGRPPKPDQPSNVGFGVPDYGDLAEDDSAFQLLRTVEEPADQGGPPPNPDQHSNAAFGVPEYRDICEEDSAWPFAESGVPASSPVAASGAPSALADGGGAPGRNQAPPEAAPTTATSLPAGCAGFGKPRWDALPHLDLSVHEEILKFIEEERAEAEKPIDPERQRRIALLAYDRHMLHEKLGGYDRPVQHSPHVQSILAMQERRIAGLE